MPSYKVFGIYVDKTHTQPISINNDELNDRISHLISNKLIHKVVIQKEWI